MIKLRKLTSKMILIVSLIILVCQGIHAEEEIFKECPELEGTPIDIVSNWFSTNGPFKGSKFYIGLKNKSNNNGLLEINTKNVSALIKDQFNASLKTIVIIHGYKSNSQKPWVLEMKNILLKQGHVNVILVDWSDGFDVRYLNSARTTVKVARDLTELLKAMKAKLPEIKNEIPSWNHLYFIGHSLGAHIAAQTSYLLKQEEKFFKIDRITGLDPAWPCFSTARLSLKIDKSDADYVDVIHTQTKQDGEKFSLGVKEPIGHVDFYINGGIQQPYCKSSSLISLFDAIKEWDIKICSHKMAYRYFIESMNNTKSCPLEGHPWNQTYADAVQIFEKVKNNEPCTNCIELGRDSPNNVGNSTTYLVFTSMEAPYCSLKKGDIPEIENKLKLLQSASKKPTWNLLFDIGKRR